MENGGNRGMISAGSADALVVLYGLVRPVVRYAPLAQTARDCSMPRSKFNLL